MRTIAIGIPSYRRPEGLKTLLESIALQDLGRHQVRLRVIVVDNEPEDLPDSPTQEMLRQMKPGFPFALDIYRERERGIVHARNAIIAALKDEDALFFIDDDEVAPPHWIRTMLDFWETHPEADMLFGPMARKFSGGEAFDWVQASQYHSTYERPTGMELNFAYTNNLMITRKVWESIRPLFEADYNYSGGSDYHMSVLAHRQGMRIFWVNEACVTEIEPPHRANFTWIFLRGLRCGSVQGYICRKTGRKGQWKSYTLRLGYGGLTLPLGLITFSKRRIYNGLFSLAYGAGGFLGLWFGYRYYEYKTM